MPPSSTDIFLRYCTESCKIFTAYAMLTDGTIPSVIYRWKYRRNYFVGIFPAGNFFFAHFPFVKPSVFYYVFYRQN